MLIFWKKRLVIFSVPKTGTSAIDKVLAPLSDMAILAPPTLKHMPVYRYNRFMYPLFETVDKRPMQRFAIIREPESWLGSWYRYRKRSVLDNSPQSTKNISFDEFVIDALKGTPSAYANVGNQARFLSGGVGPSGVDHLFQYEQMNLACQFLEQRIGCDIKLETVNTSPQEELFLSKKTKEKLIRKRQAEFRIWENAYR